MNRLRYNSKAKRKSKQQISQIAEDSFRAFRPFINIFDCGEFYDGHPYHLITKLDWALYRRHKAGERGLTYPNGTTFPRYLAPFHAWAYDQDETMEEVVRLGLVKSAKHASPIFSNYPINWLLMYSDLRHFGYNPYLPEFATLIREGKASLRQWRMLGPLVDFMIRRKIFLGAEVRRSMAWLGLSESDLAVNKPRGAYDPPILAK